jgi:hypothetical protein
MDWLDDIPAPARLALSVGGAVLASQANLLPASFHVAALAAGMALCAYGLAASMGPLLKSRERLDAARKKDFERQRRPLIEKFRNVKPGA